MVITGLLIMFNNLTAAAVTLAVVVFSYCAIVIAEENYLVQRFGIEYQSYCRRVPRWWPNFKGVTITARSASISWRQVIAKAYTSAYSWIIMMVSVLTYKAWLFREFASMPERIGLAGVFASCSVLFLLRVGSRSAVFSPSKPMIMRLAFGVRSTPELPACEVSYRQ